MRLGITLMALYEVAAREWLEETIDREEDIEDMVDPLWLHAAVHAATSEGGKALDPALSQDPVRLYLRPAARSFLEARRSCPAAALSHAGLGGVDYLIERGEPGSTHAERAMRLSGLAGHVAARAGRIASQVGDLDLAARCWRRAFGVGLSEAEWVEAARSAAAALPAEIILDRVLEPSGEDTLRFACRVFPEPDDAVVRDRFLRAALQRISHDPGPESARLWHEGQALAWLDDRERARERMRSAVESEPLRGEWRDELVEWLIGWGDVDEAHRQAVVGAALQPQRPASCSTLKKAIAAVAMKTTSAAFGPTSKGD